MIASDVERFCNAPPQTLPFPALKISDTFRIKTGYGQNEETRREGERELETPPAQITVRVQKVSPRLPPMRITTRAVLLIIIAFLLRYGLASQTPSAQPHYISNRENGQAMIPAKEGSVQAAHGKVETLEEVEDTDRIGRKSAKTQPPVDPCARNPRWWQRIRPAPNVHQTLTQATYPKQIMKTTKKSPMAKSTTAKGQTMEKDADTSKYRDMPRVEISPRSPSYLALAKDDRNLAVEILQKKWPKEAEGVKDQKEGIKIGDVKLMVMPSPAKIMCVPAGTMIDPKKAGYLYLAFLSSRVQTSYNFVIMEVKAGNYTKLARIYDSPADDYMKERRGDKTPFTMEDEVTELMSTFPINAKWLADHSEGSNAFDIETAATLYTIYQMLHDIFESGTRPAAAISAIILTRPTTVTPALNAKPPDFGPFKETASSKVLSIEFSPRHPEGRVKPTMRPAKGAAKLHCTYQVKPTPTHTFAMTYVHSYVPHSQYTMALQGTILPQVTPDIRIFPTQAQWAGQRI